MIIALHSLGNVTSVGKLVAAVSSGTASGQRISAGSATTNSVTVSVTGGVQPYIYAWSSSAGDTIAISSTTTSTVSWSGSGTPPTSSTATWACLITDAMGASATSSNVSVSLSFNQSTLAASLSTNTVTDSRNGDGEIITSAVSAVVSDGVPPYTYAWTKVSGTTLTLSNASGASTTFAYTGTVGETITATYQCVVTDSNSDTVNAGSVNITLVYNTNALSVSVTPTSVYADLIGTGVVTTDTVYSTVTGGTAPYSYSWLRSSGDTGIYADNPTGSTTTFSRYGSPYNLYNANWYLIVTDANSQTASSSTVIIQLQFDY